MSLAPHHSSATSNPTTYRRSTATAPDGAAVTLVGAGELDAPYTRADLDRLPAALDVPTAARVLGIGRTMAYELVRSGQWPTPVVRIGRLVKIPTAPLVALLGATGAAPTPTTDPPLAG